MKHIKKTTQNAIEREIALIVGVSKRFINNHEKEIISDIFNAILVKAYEKELLLDQTPTKKELKKGFTKQTLKDLETWKVKEEICSLLVKEIVKSIYKTNRAGKNYTIYNINEVLHRMQNGEQNPNMKEIRV